MLTARGCVIVVRGARATVTLVTMSKSIRAYRKCSRQWEGGDMDWIPVSQQSDQDKPEVKAEVMETQPEPQPRVTITEVMYKGKIHKVGRWLVIAIYIGVVY